MSHDPLDPTGDPLLAKLGQLGVPAGGAPKATAAALLSKAAVAAPVVGLAGAKLYAAIGGALLLGLGGGAVVTELVRHDGPPPAEPAALVAPVPSLEQCEDLLGATAPPEPEPAAEAVVEERLDPAPAPPRVVYVTRYVEVCEDATAAMTTSVPPATDEDDDWIGEPDDDAPEWADSTPYPPRDLEEQPLADATATAEVVPIPRRAGGPLQPAEGHLRLGLGGGGATFYDFDMGSLTGAVGIELLGPGPAQAAPLLAANLDVGMMESRRTLEWPLGTLTVDGEAGVAFRPRPDLRISLSGIGGVRVLDGAAWEYYVDWSSLEDPEEESSLAESLSEDALVMPTFGGRIGFVLGDRRKSPVAFRASMTGQAMVFSDPVGDEVAVIPWVGGTVGIDVLLPPPEK